jgi:hypothetical protein
MTAAPTVFTVPELHEIILEHEDLSFSKVLRLRLVSRQWKTIIETSLPLKKKLFLVAESNDNFRLDHSSAVSDKSVKRQWDNLWLWGHKLPEVNGLLLPPPPPPLCHAPHTWSSYRRYWVRLNKLYYPKPGPQPRFTDLLRSMYLTQPPVPVAHLSMSVAGGSFVDAGIRADGGLTIGAIIDVLGDMREGYQSQWRDSDEVFLGAYFYVQEDAPEARQSGRVKNLSFAEQLAVIRPHWIDWTDPIHLAAKAVRVSP